MFRAFGLDFQFAISSQLVEEGRKILKGDKAWINSTLERYVKPGGHLDAAEIMNDWFEEIDAHVFISHSHADEDKALCIAGLLKRELGIRSFVDSAVWGHYYGLLDLINEFSWRDKANGLYDHEKCIRSDAHVHLMLASSLSKMINRTEAVFFLKTPHSITSREAVDNTRSPWIYFELEVLRTIQIRPASEHRQLVKKALGEHMENFSGKDLEVRYPVDYERLTPLSDDLFRQWINRAPNDAERALDDLYRRAPDDMTARIL